MRGDSGGHIWPLDGGMFRTVMMFRMVSKATITSQGPGLLWVDISATIAMTKNHETNLDALGQIDASFEWQGIGHLRSTKCCTRRATRTAPSGVQIAGHHEVWDY
jgi:hypothetical protein